jgi:hypothetical protein
MRLESTLTDSRAQAVDKLADELALSHSQVVDEAVAMFTQAVTAARSGRRLVAMSSDAAAVPDCLITTPTLAALEWTSGAVELTVSPEALQRIRALIAEPPTPSTRVRAALARFKTATPGE